MSWLEWFKKYFLNIDGVIAICIFCAVVYFVVTQKKKKYKFLGLGAVKGQNPKKIKKKKKVSKKGVKRVNKHEEECRRIFQNIFGKQFKSTRPDWLKNPTTGKNLELDGFCQTIETPKGVGLAFEYDGEQHAKFNSHFHKKGHDEFVYQVKKDTWKDLKCKERGVTLIRIPHFVAYTDLRRYILSELERQKVAIPVMNRGIFTTNNMYN